MTVHPGSCTVAETLAGLCPGIPLRQTTIPLETARPLVPGGPDLMDGEGASPATVHPQAQECPREWTGRTGVETVCALMRWHRWNIQGDIRSWVLHVSHHHGHRWYQRILLLLYFTLGSQFCRISPRCLTRPGTAWRGNVPLMRNLLQGSVLMTKRVFLILVGGPVLGLLLPTTMHHGLWSEGHYWLVEATVWGCLPGQDQSESGASNLL